MSDKKMATREAYGEFLLEEGEKNNQLVVMDADLSGSTKTKGFAKKFKDRFFQSGISEQDMMAEAAGIALSGFTVCASTFAMFAVGRAYEIIRNSIAYTSANVKVCATHAGITVGEDGASHQTFEDVSLMRGIPNMNVIVPADGVSAKKLLKEEIKRKGPAYMRLGRSKVDTIYDESATISVGKANKLREGKDVAIIANGIMVSEALKAAEELEERGIYASVIDMHTVKPLDEKAILEVSEKVKFIVTAEEHSIIGGLGSAVLEALAEKGNIRVFRVGQLDTFGESGSPKELLEKYSMTKADIIEKVLKNI